jgi:hypothetical protein
MKDIGMSRLEVADLESVLGTGPGRRLYYRIIFQVACLESASYQASGQAMAYQEGRRSVAIALMQEAQAICPELWIRMLKERLTAAEIEVVDRRLQPNREEGIK